MYMDIWLLYDKTCVNTNNAFLIDQVKLNLIVFINE